MSAQKRKATMGNLDARAPSAEEDVSSAERPPVRGGVPSRSTDDRLNAELDRFVAEHPGGWNHDEWLGLLGTLRDRGYETSDQDAIGLALEDRRRG